MCNTLALKLIFHATELFNQSIVNTLLGKSISRHKHHFHRGAQIRCSKFNQFNLITVSRRTVSSSQTVLGSSYASARVQSIDRPAWIAGKIRKVSPRFRKLVSEPKFWDDNWPTIIVHALRRYRYRYRHGTKSSVACRVWKSDFTDEYGVFQACRIGKSLCVISCSVSL